MSESTVEPMPPFRRGDPGELASDESWLTQPGWLEAPDGDGLWWVGEPDVPNSVILVRLTGERVEQMGTDVVDKLSVLGGQWWQRVAGPR